MRSSLETADVDEQRRPLPADIIVQQGLHPHPGPVQHFQIGEVAAEHPAGLDNSDPDEPPELDDGELVDAPDNLVDGSAGFI